TRSLPASVIRESCHTMADSPSPNARCRANLAAVTLPSVLLHDHLDGGLRPATILDIADTTGYRDLPADEPEALGAWFDQSESGSLERYLESFQHTIGVMQDAGSLERVAHEADRKSTRLNSSHVKISYAVFC